MRRLKFAHVRLCSAATLAVLIVATACSDTTGSGHEPAGGSRLEESGELGLALQLASGQSLLSASYTIVGPNGFSKSGGIDLANSSAIGATIPLPVGSGYSITLAATSSDGQAQCRGSASFSITAHQTTPLLVPISCHEAARTGSVSINGTLNICPTLDGINATPAEVAIGGSVALEAVAHDSDAGPAALSYAWTVTGGSLSDAQSPRPRFTCSSVGPVTLRASVSDGDAAPNCADSATVQVTCTSGSGTGGASGAGGSGGASGAGGSGTSGAASGGASSGGASSGGAASGGAASGGAASGGAASGGAASGGASSGGASSGGASSGGGGPATHVVVYRVGDGATVLANTGNPVFLDEFSGTGALVHSTAMPASPGAGSHRLVASGTATSEGFISRSSNGRYLVFTGYDSTLPASASLAASAANAVPRTVGRLDASGNLDTTTGLTDAATGNNPRSVASSDGASLWVTGGAGGIRFATLGSSTSLQLSTTVTNLRQVAIFGSQLYVSDSSGSAVRLGTVGSGLPTTAGQIINNLPGIPAGTGSPYGFFFADLDANTPGLDVLYLADDGAGITKYSLVAGTWTANGTLGTASDAYRGLTGVASGSSVSLYATRKGGSTASGGGELVQVVDSSGFNGALSGTATLLASAPSNTAFRGVALAPQAEQR